MNFPIDIKGEWGAFHCRNMLEWLSMTREQLRHYLRHGLSPNPIYTQVDIDGYTEILKLGDELTAVRFVREKAAAKDRGQPFKDNLAVIAHMKASGLWGIGREAYDPLK